MDIIVTIFIFIMGLLIGSFLNVCIYRIPREESIAYPPSHCTVCGNRIKPYDLIPVLSWILLRGKCRYCGEKISIRYALIEMITGIFFALTYLKYGYTLECFKFIILIPFLIVIGMIDYDTTDVYAKTTWTGTAVGIIFIIVNFYYGLGIKTYIYGGLLGGGVISLIILITRGMGWGDAEICLLSGVFLGLPSTILMLFMSFVIGGLSGVILIASGKKTRKDYIPFGPSIVAASIMTILIGNNIMNWYMNIFFPY